MLTRPDVFFSRGEKLKLKSVLKHIKKNMGLCSTFKAGDKALQDFYGLIGQVVNQMQYSILDLYLDIIPLLCHETATSKILWALPTIEAEFMGFPKETKAGCHLRNLRSELRINEV